jgi:hypothetical protein
MSWYVGLVAALLELAPAPLVAIPYDVVRSLGTFGYPIPAAAASVRVVHADLDGNGLEDWSVLVDHPGGDAAILVAYRFPDGWRAGNIDVWQQAACCGSRGPHPASIKLLPAGRYEQAPPFNRALQGNERASIVAERSGVLVTLADGRRRAYVLGTHTWQFVYLSFER